MSRSVGAKLFTLLFAVMLLNLGLLGYANVRLHRQHLEAAAFGAAQRVNDVITRSTSYYMLRNDRAALAHTFETLGREPDIAALRIYNSGGTIAFSTRRDEIGKIVDLAILPREGNRIDTTRGERIMRIVTPIDNAPSCSSAACHAHPATEKRVGTLSTETSLAPIDRRVRTATWQFVGLSAVTIFLMLVASGGFVLTFVQKPVSALHHGTERLRAGDLGVQIEVMSDDELGELASSFNDMSTRLRTAQDELTDFTRSLEERVRQKTAELTRAHQQMIQAEKLTSLGKLAAVVAHEINNPLSGILTYAKLLRKWVDRGESIESRGKEMHDALALIESESRRCGDIVRNLLTFARVAPMNITDFDVNAIIRQCIRLVEHKLELGNITPDLELAANLPKIRGDSGQIEQLLLALTMNAIEAMPREGNLRLTTSVAADHSEIVVTVEDDGTGIAPEVLDRLFDPFVTTKEEKGVGLGLAISRAIVDRHQGRIEVASEIGRGTKFTITLPVVPEPPAEDRPQALLEPAEVGA
ncbi:MAG TPA: ATP-binding protein [Thermoanaerobaculia bacterium]|nr:ATP-binding protein [Thermoanaerobaculia bacterium]